MLRLGFSFSLPINLIMINDVASANQLITSKDEFLQMSRSSQQPREVFVLSLEIYHTIDN